MRTKTFVVVGILAALLVAGVGSYFASRHPDGLMHVAEKTGFIDKARQSPASDSPLSGYRVKGVENPAVSRGLAGVIGAGVVLLLAGGLTYVVRRKGAADGAGPGSTDAHAPEREDERAPQELS